jgi:indole-3-glycerol phosphate synthase
VHANLAEILAEKRKEVDILKNRNWSTHCGNNVPPIRDFKGVISVPDKISLIAEIKFASPSAGIICKKTDPVTIGKIYEKAGAAAISLLTDKKFFGGDLNHLSRLKKAISLPVLRKDFIIDEVQVRESFLGGADATLLIARILSHRQLKDLRDICHDLGMAALVEVHDRQDIEKAVACGADIVGINNRDLNTFNVSLETTLKLAPLVPEGHIIVSESGVKNKGDLQLLKQAGIQAVLVGTSLMKSKDIGKKVMELMDAYT